MFNAIDKLINTINGIGKESTRLVVPTYTEPAKPTRHVITEELVSYIRITVNGKIYEGQEALDFLNKK